MVAHCFVLALSRLISYLNTLVLTPLALLLALCRLVALYLHKTMMAVVIALSRLPSPIPVLALSRLMDFFLLSNVSRSLLDGLAMAAMRLALSRLVALYLNKTTLTAAIALSRLFPPALVLALGRLLHFFMFMIG